jgi:PPM family protein phosphatase
MKLSFEVISQKGKRENNEDCSYPVSSHSPSELFLVCDGVGGANKGEVASRIACKSIVEILDGKSELNFEELNKALEYAEHQLANYLSENPDSEGMATTLTLLMLQENAAFVGYAGDSRVYHIRDGEILFQTKDHSLINELISTGYITEEEAKTHPNRNVITKAITGDGKHTQADSFLIASIQVGDFFLLCSDGVLEAVDELFISKHFITNNSPQSIVKLIEQECSLKSNDNFSAIVVKVDELEDVITANKVLEKQENDLALHNYSDSHNVLVESRPAISTKLKSILLIAFLTAVAILLYYFFFKPTDKAKPQRHSSLEGTSSNSLYQAYNFIK